MLTQLFFHGLIHGPDLGLQDNPSKNEEHGGLSERSSQPLIIHSASQHSAAQYQPWWTNHILLAKTQLPRTTPRLRTAWGTGNTYWRPISALVGSRLSVLSGHGHIRNKQVLPLAWGWSQHRGWRPQVGRQGPRSPCLWRAPVSCDKSPLSKINLNPSFLLQWLEVYYFLSQLIILVGQCIPLTN